MTRSWRYFPGVYSVASFPEFVSIKYDREPCHTPRKTGFCGLGNCGSVNDSFPSLPSALSMNSLQRGEIVIPAMFSFMGVLLLFPAHAPTTIFGVYPTVHASW